MIPATIDPIAPAWLGLTALVAVRTGGILLVAPVFAARTVPAMLRAALLVLITLLLLPAAAAAAGAAEPPGVTAAALATETLIGFAIGLGAAVLVGAAETAGDVLAIQTGLSGAATLDPVSQQTSPVLSQLTGLFAAILLLALDWHVIALEALAASLAVAPAGAAVAARAGLAELVSLGGTLFSIGLRFAAPVTAVVLVSNLALGMLARTVPQLNVLMVAFPVQIGVGLGALGLALPLIATFFQSFPVSYEAVLSRVFGAFVGGGAY